MTPAGQQSKKAFHHCGQLCCHFFLHVRVSDFNPKWQIAPWAALSQQRTLMAGSRGGKGQATRLVALMDCWPGNKPASQETFAARFSPQQELGPMCLASLPSPGLSTLGHLLTSLSFTLGLLMSHSLCQLFCGHSSESVSPSLASEMCGFFCLFFSPFSSLKPWSSQHSSGICVRAPQDGTVHRGRAAQPLSSTACFPQQQQQQQQLRHRAVAEIEGYLLHWN